MAAPHCFAPNCHRKAAHFCGVCDGWWCDEHSDHGPDGNGGHIGARAAKGRIVFEMERASVDKDLVTFERADDAEVLCMVALRTKDFPRPPRRLRVTIERIG